MKTALFIASILLSPAFAIAAEGGSSLSPEDSLVARHSSLVTGGDGEDAAPAWVPLAAERDVEPGSALDFSWISKAHAPCGVHGRAVVRDGHFEFEGRPGEPVRFWGVNISSGANFPDEDKAERIAAHLAALGYNAVRIHHHDGGLVAQNPDAFGPAEAPGAPAEARDDPSKARDLAVEVRDDPSRTTGLDPDALRRHDALVAACARHGLYIATDLYVSRPVSWRAAGIDRDGTMGKGEFKHLVPVHDGAFSNFCAFAAAWLGHTNAFTGVRFADDPALLSVALVNEGNLDNGAGPEPFVSLPNWKEKWAAWLAARAAPPSDERKVTSDESVDTAGKSLVTRHSSLFTAGEVADFAGIPPGNHWQRTRHVAAFSRFLADVEADFEARAVRFLREEVGLKAPVSNMSSWMQPPEYQGVLAGPTQDYVEAHAYSDHPTFPGKAWGLPCRVGAENPVRKRSNSAGSGAMGATLKRVFGKPFCVTEFNYCAPNPHRGAGGLLFGAEAAAQDWSGAWRFDWAATKQAIESPETVYCGLFAIGGDPLRQASERIAAALFLRGDLAPCADAYAVLLPPSKITGSFDGESTQLNTPWPELAWRARLGTVWAEEAPSWAKWVDPYPDYYKRTGPVADLPPRDDIAVDREAGWFKVATPRTCAVFAEGGTHEAGCMRISLAALPPVSGATPPSGPSALSQLSGEAALTAAEGGNLSGDALAATVWASSLDGEPLASSKRILVGFLTDLRNTGTEMEEEEAAILVRKWGTTPHLVRAGKTRVELALDPATDWRCFALSQGGRHLAEVFVTRAEDGRLALDLDNAAAGTATMFWELVRR